MEQGKDTNKTHVTIFFFFFLLTPKNTKKNCRRQHVLLFFFFVFFIIIIFSEKIRLGILWESCVIGHFSIYSIHFGLDITL